MSKVYGNEGQEYEPASLDIHDAVCCEVSDLGIQDGPYGAKHQGVLVFQVAETREDGKRKEVRFYFNMTLGSKSYPSKLRKLVEKWRGREFTEDEEKEGFDPEVLVGQPCRIDVNHRESREGRKYAVIDSLSRPGDTKLKPVDYVPLDERMTNGDSDSTEVTGDDDVPF